MKFRDFFEISIFFFNDTATTEIYTLSLHDALPIFEVNAAGVEEVVTKTIIANPASFDLGILGIAIEIGRAHVRTPVT